LDVCIDMEGDGLQKKGGFRESLSKGNAVKGKDRKAVGQRKKVKKRGRVVCSVASGGEEGDDKKKA